MIAPLAVHVDRLNEAKRYWVAPRDISTDFWLSTFARQDIRWPPRARNVRVPLREKGLARETGSLRVSLVLALRRFAAPAHAARQRLCQAVHLNLGLPLVLSARSGGQDAGSLHLFEERHGRVRESDASGDTPRGSLKIMRWPD